MTKTDTEITYKGIAVSEGVIIGKIFKLDSGHKPVIKLKVDKALISDEIAKFENLCVTKRCNNSAKGSKCK